MTTIGEIQKLETGARIKNLTATVKRPKHKIRVVGGTEFTQEVVLSDMTGDIQAEVLLRTPNYGYIHELGRAETIKVHEAEVQNGADGVKLFVRIYSQDTQPEPDEPHYTSSEIEGNTSPNWQAISTGKVRHGVVCAYIQAGKEPDKEIVKKWTEFIMTGK